MPTKLLSLFVVCHATYIASTEPAPGRIPKVYNALITSNQNLEPSKAYPVYQPVLHNTFPFPFQTVYYGDYPLTNSLLPPPALIPKDPNATQPPPAASDAETETSAPATEKPAPSPEESTPAPENTDQSGGPPPPPPNTESPIPLNGFGLPPQVLPLGRIDPGYDFTQVGPYPYPYPGLRFYDPYDPFSFNPYANFPLYRPLPNLLGQGPSLPIPSGKDETVVTAAPVTPTPSGQTPPPEPNDLNVLNYSSKDPAIPNVPPPPLPQGGLKIDKVE